MRILAISRIHHGNSYLEGSKGGTNPFVRKIIVIFSILCSRERLSDKPVPMSVLFVYALRSGFGIMLWNSGHNSWCFFWKKSPMSSESCTASTMSWLDSLLDDADAFFGFAFVFTGAAASSSPKSDASSSSSFSWNFWVLVSPYLPPLNFLLLVFFSHNPKEAPWEYHHSWNDIKILTYMFECKKKISSYNWSRRLLVNG